MKNTVWIVGGNDDDGNDDVCIYSTYEKARDAFESTIHDILCMEEEDCVIEHTDTWFEYDAGNHYGILYIKEEEVR